MILRGRGVRRGLGAAWWCVPVLLGLLSACGSDGGNPANTAQLARHLVAARCIDLHVGVEGLEERARSTLAEVTEKEIHTGPDGAGSRVVVGLFTDPVVREVLEAVGFGGEESGQYLIEGQAYHAPGDAILLSCEDPARPGLPIALYAAADEKTLAFLIEDLRPMTRKPSVRAYRLGQVFLEAPIAPGNRLKKDEIDLVYARRQALRATHHPQPPWNGVMVWSSATVSQERAGEYLEVLKAARSKALTACGASDMARNPVVELVGTAAEYEALGGRHDLAFCNPTAGLVTVLLAEGLPNDGGAALAEAIALDLWGPAKEPWVSQAFGISLGTYWGRTILQDGPTSLPFLRRPQVLRGDDAPSARIERLRAQARYLAHLRNSAGPDALRALWIGERSAPETWEPPPSRFTVTERPDPGTRHSAGVAVDALPPSAELLRAARDLGATSISFCCTFYEQPGPPEYLGERRTAGWELEEGEALLAAAIAQARGAGYEHVLLRPRLLTSPGFGAAGWERRTDATDWEGFFDALVPATRQAATFADLSGCDWYCVAGPEGDVTAFRGPGSEDFAEEQDRVLRAGWTRINTVARECFDRQLTFAASWPMEAKGFPLWRQYDAIGLSWFPKIESRDGRRPGPQAMNGFFGWHLEEMNKFSVERQQPYLLVDFGLPSTAAATRNTALAAGPTDEARQAELYRAFAAALDDTQPEGSPFVGAMKGIHLWKLAAPGPGADRRFTPFGKQAQAVLPEIFALGGE